MDKDQEELQFLGFLGIWRESFKIIIEWTQIFIKLGLALTLPLSFIYLAHIEINHLISQHMMLALATLAISSGDTNTYKIASRALSRELAWYAFIQLAYIIFLFVFSLLSTSAIVYTVACIYSGKKLTFKEVICVVPKVWKRLMVTFLCVMAIMFAYNFVFVCVVMIGLLTYPFDDPNHLLELILVGRILAILYFLGVCYMGLIWQLANTISVLEESYGFQALRKSKLLMKGKMGISIGIYFVNNLCVGGALWLYNSFVVFDRSNVGMLGRVGFGAISLLLLCILILLGIVVNTVFYLVCKSYHHERIDKSALADHLEVYHGEGYFLLGPKDVQLVEKV